MDITMVEIIDIELLSRSHSHLFKQTLLVSL